MTQILICICTENMTLLLDILRVFLSSDGRNISQISILLLKITRSNYGSVTSTLKGK